MASDFAQTKFVTQRRKVGGELKVLECVCLGTIHHDKSTCLRRIRGFVRGVFFGIKRVTKSQEYGSEFMVSECVFLDPMRPDKSTCLR